MREWQRYELDPVGYRPRNEGNSSVRMTEDLMLEYSKHQLRRGLSREWVGEVGRCLAAWAVALGARDLRALDYHRDILRALDRWHTRRAHRIKAIKGFVKFLRVEKGLLKSGQGGVEDLHVPVPRAAKNKRRKVVAFEDVNAVWRHLKQPTRDVMHIITATSWHLSEVRRFAEGGEMAEPMRGDALAVIYARHKTGDLAKQSLRYLEHVDAARRLLALGKLPKRMTLARHMRAACAAAGVPKFGLGQLRHSTLTWGVESGAAISEAADFAQHRSDQTTRKYYVDLEIPKTTFPVRRLV